MPSAVAPTQTPAPYKYTAGDIDYLGSDHHRWLLPFDIGVITANGSNAIQIAQGLTAGQAMVVNTDQMPDRWLVVVWGEGASGAAVNNGVRIARITLGSGTGGAGYQLGAGGKLKIPAQGQNFLTIQNIATAAITLHGTIVAIGGWDFSNIDVG